MKKLIGVLVAALLGGSVVAAPTVRNLNVTAIPPWGLALDYTVNGAEDTEWLLVVMATDGAKTYSARNLVGATDCVNGAHRVYWNMAADGLTATATNGTVTVSYLYRQAADPQPQIMGPYIDKCVADHRS